MTTVLVSSGGGHLQQLYALAPRMGLGSDVVWVTPRSGLSDCLFRDQAHVEIPYSPPRDWQAALRLTRSAQRILTRTGARRIVSTGASPAPPFFVAGARLGLEMHYIESATRSRGPSLSGRLVAKVPSAHLYTQYRDWASDRWRFSGSIFDSYSATAAPVVHSRIGRVVVTLGTEAYGFRRAVERLIKVLPKDAQVLWQTGHTDVSGLPIRGLRSVPGDELRAEMAKADLIVSHAGTGTALTAFDLGRAPLMLPREARHLEHVDDHQSFTAHELGRRGLAVAVGVDELTAAHLSRAQRIRVVRDQVERPFMLDREMAVDRVSVLDLRVPRRLGSRPIRKPVVIDLRDRAVSTAKSSQDEHASAVSDQEAIVDLKVRNTA